MKGNVIIGQSGGPTAVINSSLAGVIKAARVYGVEKIYGMHHGIEGFLKEDIIDNSTSEEDINKDNIVEEEKELEESKSASIDNLENKVKPQEVKDKNKIDSKELYSVNLCKRKRNRY